MQASVSAIKDAPSLGHHAKYRRWLRLGTACFAGVLAGLCISAGDYAAIGWAALLSLGVGLVARRLAPAELKEDLVAIALCAVTLHMAVALTIQTAATASGGFVTGDDASYYRLAKAFTRFLQDATLDPSYSPPLWGGDAYLFGAFVYLETVLFLIFGPDVRLMLLLNSALACLTALLVFRTARRLFGRDPAVLAAVVVAFFPSLILWSALNLKDSLTTMLAVLGVSAAVEFQHRPRPGTLLLPFAAAEVLVTLRSYVAATIAFTALLSIALTALPARRRLAATALAGVLTLVVVAQGITSVGSEAGDQILVTLERERAAMAVGARTGFVPTPTPRPSVQGTPHPDEVSPVRTLTYLPTGLAYAIFAPFPPFARRPQEIAAAPEMLVWYVMVVAGVATIWRERRRWAHLAPLVLAIGGLMLVFALAEGNIGTLFRHRAMVIPFAAALASPSVIAFWIQRRASRVRAITADGDA